MNYDNSISDKVNLSRILDEMIMDGTGLETIVQFLRSHEKSIPEIYGHSAFVYDLYDLGLHPYRYDEFLVDHIKDLPTVEFCFALNSLANFLIITGANNTILGELRNKYHGAVELVKFSRAGWNGMSKDDKFFKHDETNLIEWLNGNRDARDISSFISSSFLAMSAFQAGTYLQLKPDAQYALLIELGLLVSESYMRRSYEQGVDKCVCGKLIINLMRQLLVLDRVDMFNWIEKVVGNNGNGLFATMRQTLVNQIPTSIAERMPTLEFAWKADNCSFEEIVFDMNMLESQFEPYDLFMYIYLFDNVLFSGMKENKELIEFFNLPFDWESLDKFKETSNGG